MSLVPCTSCGKRVDPLSRLIAYEVRGFEKARTGGGTNHLMFRERTGRVMCGGCVLTKRHTGNAGQGTLL